MAFFTDEQADESGKRSSFDEKYDFSTIAVAEPKTPKATATASPIVTPTPEQEDIVQARNIQDHIDNMAIKYDVDSNLIRGIIRTESNWNRRIVSKAGAQGLMQLMPDTAKDMGVEDAFDPYQNIEGGVKYFSQMLKRANGDFEAALQMYNAGPTKTDKVYGGKIDTVSGKPHKFRQETIDYVPKVLKYTQLYGMQKKMAEIPPPPKGGYKDYTAMVSALPPPNPAGKNKGKVESDLDFFSGRTLKKAIVAPLQGFGDVARWLGATAANRDTENWLKNGSDFTELTTVEFKQQVVDRAYREGKTVDEMRRITAKERGAASAKFWNEFADSMPDEIEGSSGAWEDGITGLLRFVPSMAVTAANPASGLQMSAAQLAGPKYKEYVDAGVPEKLAWQLSVSYGFGAGIVELGGNMTQIGLVKALFKTKAGTKGLLKVPAKFQRYMEATLLGPISEGAEEVIQYDLEKMIDLYAAMPNADSETLMNAAERMKASPEFKEGRMKSGKAGMAGGFILGGGAAQVKGFFDVIDWLNTQDDLRIERELDKQEQDAHEEKKLEEKKEKPKREPEVVERDTQDKETPEPTIKEDKEIDTKPYKLTDIGKKTEPVKSYTEFFDKYDFGLSAEQDSTPTPAALDEVPVIKEEDPMTKPNSSEELLKSGEEIPEADTKAIWNRLTQPAVLHANGITLGPKLVNKLTPSEGPPLLQGGRTEIGQSWSKARNEARKQGFDMTDSQEGFWYTDKKGKSRFIHKNAKQAELESKAAERTAQVAFDPLKKFEQDEEAKKQTEKLAETKEKLVEAGGKATEANRETYLETLGIKEGDALSKSKIVQKAVNHPSVKYLERNKADRADIESSVAEAIWKWFINPKNQNKKIPGQGYFVKIGRNAAQNAAKEARGSRAAIDKQLKETGGKLKDDLSLREDLIADTGQAVTERVKAEEGLETPAKQKERAMAIDTKVKAIDKLQAEVMKLLKNKKMDSLVKARKIKALRAGIRTLALRDVTEKSQAKLKKKRAAQAKREAAAEKKQAESMRRDFMKFKEAGKKQKPLTTEQKTARRAAQSKIQVGYKAPKTITKEIEKGDYPRRSTAEVELEDMQKANPKADLKIRKAGPRFKIVESVETPITVATKEQKAKIEKETKRPTHPLFVKPSVMTEEEFIATKDAYNIAVASQNLKKAGKGNPAIWDFKPARSMQGKATSKKDVEELGAQLVDIDSATEKEEGTGLEQFGYYSLKQRKPLPKRKPKIVKKETKKQKFDKEVNKVFGTGNEYTLNTTVDEIIETPVKKEKVKDQELEKLVAEQEAERQADQDNGYTDEDFFEEGGYALDPEKEQDDILDIIKNERGDFTEMVRSAANLTLKGYHFFRNIFDKIDIEAPWKRIGADTAGRAFKNFFGTRTRHQIEGIQDTRKIIKATKQSFHKEGLGAPTTRDWFDIVMASEDPNYLEDNNRPKSRRSAIETAADMMTTYFEGKEQEFADRGIHFDAHERMITELMEKGRLPETTAEERQKIIEQIEVLDRLKWTHIPIAVLYSQMLKASNDTKWSPKEKQGIKGLLDLFVTKKKTTTLHNIWQRAATKESKKSNTLSKQQKLMIRLLNPASLLMNYQHRNSKDFALLDIRDALEADGLLAKGSDKKPSGFTTLTSREWGVLQNNHVDPKATDMINNLLSMDNKQNKWEKFASLMKMTAFYNPIFLPMYDIFQSAMTLSPVKKLPWVTAGNIFKAIGHVMKQDEVYKDAMSAGLFSKPFDFPWQDWHDQMNTVMRSTSRHSGFSGGMNDWVKTQAIDFARTLSRPKKMSLVGSFYEASWNTAWKMDEMVRMFTYMQLKKKNLPVDVNAAQVAAKFHGDYASVPPKTRKALNKIFFTPTFKIVMGKLYGEMISNIFKSMGKAMIGGTGWERRNEQMLTGLIGIMAVNYGFDALMNSLGYEPEDEKWWNYGRRYQKKLKGGREGAPARLIISASNPSNMIQRYLQRIMTEYISGRMGDNWSKSLFRVIKWDLHPIFTTTLSLMENRKPDGTEIYNPHDDKGEKALRSAHFMTTNLIRLGEAGPAAFGYKVGELSEPKDKVRAKREIAKDFGKWAFLFDGLLSVASGHLTSIGEVKDAQQINQVKATLKKGLKEYALQHDGDVNYQWLRNARDKIGTVQAKYETARQTKVRERKTRRQKQRERIKELRQKAKAKRRKKK